LEQKGEDWNYWGYDSNGSKKGGYEYFFKIGYKAEEKLEGPE
jgi:hypothetical protein